MSTHISRRAILRMGLTASTVLPAAALFSFNATGGDALTPLASSDPTAQALGFVPDAAKVNAAANPSFKPAQKCASCAQFLGKATDVAGGCNIFPGKSVPASGWCKVWAAKQ
jgi:hypothetical protein